MPTNIKIPNSAWHTQDITVGGELIRLTLKYNTSDEMWYLDLANASGNTLLNGVKVMPNQSLTKRYKATVSLPDGNLWCVRRKNDFSPPSRDNLGIGKTYELWWISSNEEEEIGIDDIIQL